MTGDKMDELLLDLAQNQKESNHNLVKVFIVTVICFTILLVAMITGFFIYESHFEIVESGYTYEYDQEANSGDSGTAIVNGNGEINYGESKNPQESDN